MCKGGCGNCEDQKYTSEISYDGKKKACGVNVLRPCMDMNEIIDILFTMACRKDVLYTVDKLGASATPTGVLPSTTYTVPTGGNGIYEVLYVVDCDLPGNSTSPYSVIQFDARKNGIVIDNNAARIVKNENASLPNINVNVTYFLSQFALSEGDVFDMYMDKLGPTDCGPARGVLKLTKIG